MLKTAPSFGRNHLMRPVFYQLIVFQLRVRACFGRPKKNPACYYNDFSFSIKSKSLFFLRRSVNKQHNIIGLITAS